MATAVPPAMSAAGVGSSAVWKGKVRSCCAVRNDSSIDGGNFGSSPKPLLAVS